MVMTSGLVIHKGLDFPLTRKCSSGSNQQDFNVEKKIAFAEPRKSESIESVVLRDN